MREFSSRLLDNQLEIDCTGFFRSVVTKKRRESTHARNSPFKILSKMRACADSRRFFVTTDLKNPVYTPSEKIEGMQLVQPSKFFSVTIFRTRF